MSETGGAVLTLWGRPAEFSLQSQEVSGCRFSTQAQSLRTFDSSLRERAAVCGHVDS